MSSPDILPEMLVADLVAAYPFAVTLLAKHNLHCIICGEPVWGTLAELARDKHFTQQQLDELIDVLRIEAAS
ncbi:MAG: DUF1858 domain-containing protein [Lentimicrobium sp.]|nr:DUF1858 domain-containing protein [Lentimicrobium sp.]